LDRRDRKIKKLQKKVSAQKHIASKEAEDDDDSDGDDAIIKRSFKLGHAIPREPVHSTLQMDTHADTCVLGPNFGTLN
jgi:hypothetical protein